MASWQSDENTKYMTETKILIKMQHDIMGIYRTDKTRYIWPRDHTL